MKRTVDVLLSCIVLAILGPAIVAAAIVVCIGDGPPAFYRSRRVGKEGREFNLLKLRTMVLDAQHSKLGSVTVGDDPRVTATGRFLRRWKLDELPQVLNVLAGDMSLVGPRPETPEYVALYSVDQRQILQYKPGITSPASILFVDEADLLSRADDPTTKYAEEIMPQEIAIDLAYMRRATIWSDIGVMASTVRTVFSGSRGST